MIPTCDHDPQLAIGIHDQVVVASKVDHIIRGDDLSEKAMRGIRLGDTDRHSDRDRGLIG